MAKMSKAQRAAILNAYILRPTRQPAYRDLGVFTRKQWRSDEAALRNGWVDQYGRETTAGLVEAGVDMAAIEDWAYREHNAWMACRAPAVQRFHQLVKKARSFQGALDILHVEALQENAARSPAHVRNNCPALPVGGCMQCTAPATVRAARGEVVDAYQPAAKTPEEWDADSRNGLRILSWPDFGQGLWKILPDYRRGEPITWTQFKAARRGATIQLKPGFTWDDIDRITPRDGAAVEAPAHCGTHWVAEIQHCPRCGLTADQHPRP